MLCVIPPPAAAKVKVADPTLAFDAAASLIVRLYTPGAGLLTGEKLTVTPAGIPLTVNVTGALNPAVSLRVKPKVVLDPRATVADVGLSLSVKLGGTVTDRASVTDLVNPPPVAVMVIGRLPTAALEVARKIRTLAPDPGAARDDGEKLAVTPLGRPLVLSVTAELKPFAPLTATFVVAVPPCARLADDGLAVIAKLGGGATVTAMGSEPASPPPLAVTTML